MRQSCVLSAMAVTGLLCLVSEGKADFKICNRAKETVNLSIGYDNSDYGWTSEGWWKLEEDECTVMIRGNLANRYYYIYAAGEEGGTWSGSDKQKGGNFCVAPQKYTLHNREYETNNTLDCESGGFTGVKFDEVDTKNNKSFTYELTE
ncbi:DUF1036 domain-containing protein [Ancylobacter sp. SL191]|uniref:DUF1036 domain-containing protein n=1 Tax=Ancylobacter sp. SL191 TaxID=2995166 RepID=UPI002D1E3D12|nr:DUF1036 domain-containing protein [Ancylobacter sp. SL191]